MFRGKKGHLFNGFTKSDKINCVLGKIISLIMQFLSLKKFLLLEKKNEIGGLDSRIEWEANTTFSDKFIKNLNGLFLYDVNG